MQPLTTASPPVKIEVSCPLCGGNSHTTLFEPRVEVSDPAKLYGAASGVQGTQTIVKCATCPMIYENPRFPEEVIIAAYSASNDAGHDSQHAMRVLSFEKALRSLAASLPPPGAKLLDIGTAGGAFLEAAAKSGYDAYGLEPSRFLVEHGKARGLTIEHGTIRENNFRPESFDLITFWDVLEHLAEPRRDLEDAVRLLKKGGILLINYPDIGTWQARLAGSRFWWLLSVHLTHFNRASISEICRSARCEVISFTPYWQTLQLGYLVKIAQHLKVPLASTALRFLPSVLARIPIPYYASQTTCIARKL